jgi:hypothetical protein
MPVTTMAVIAIRAFVGEVIVLYFVHSFLLSRWGRVVTSLRHPFQIPNSMGVRQGRSSPPFEKRRLLSGPPGGLDHLTRFFWGMR